MQKAWQLLSDRSKWTQHTYARLAGGEGCDYDNPAAVSFCIRGAISKCYPKQCDKTNAIDRASAVRKRLLPETNGLSDLNDRFGYDAVMQVLKEADV